MYICIKNFTTKLHRKLTGFAYNHSVIKEVHSEKKCPMEQPRFRMLSHRILLTRFASATVDFLSAVFLYFMKFLSGLQVHVCC